MSCRHQSLVPALLLLLLSFNALPADDEDVLSLENLSQEQRLLAAVRSANRAYQLRLNAIRAELDSGDQARRVEAMSILGQKQDPSTIAWIIPYLDRDLYQPPTLKAAVHSLAQLGASNAEEPIRLLLRHDDARVRAAAINALDILEQLASRDHTQAITAQSEALRGMGATRLGILADRDAFQVLAEALRRDSSTHVRRMAAISIARLGGEAGRELIDALTDRDPLVRRYAAEGLTRLNYGPAIPYLIFALEADISSVHIIAAIRHLTGGEDFGFVVGGNVLERTRAVDRGFEWWTRNRARFEP